MRDQQLPEVCPACGARIRADADACDLCGYDGMVEEVPGAGQELGEGAGQAPVHPVAAELEQVVFCNQCGWKNPAGARFCSRCGSPLQSIGGPEAPGSIVASAPAPARSVPGRHDAAPAGPPTIRPPDLNAEPGIDVPGIKRSVGATDFRTMSAVIVAGAVLLVVALYAITAFSKKAFVPTSEPVPRETVTDEGGTLEEVVPPTVAREAAGLRASADSLRGAVRAARLAEIVNLYLSQGLYQHATEAQAAVADELETAEAWADAGNLGYRAMQEADGPRKIALASRAIDAYTRSLAIDSTNLDVRTDMATAFLATNNPMEGVRQIRMVLDQNPDHIQANFNYGVMLSMIGRTDQSIAQFERVRTLVEPGTETYQQAERALEELRGP